jgi:hypothetical protein
MSWADDFLIIAPGKDLCKLYLDRFLYICKQIGTPMAPYNRLKNGRPATTTLVAKFNKPHDI